MKLLVRRLAPKEADLTPNDVVLVQVLGPNGLVGPEIRLLAGDHMVVYDLSGSELDAKKVSVGFGQPVDVGVVEFAIAAIAAFRERARAA